MAQIAASVSRYEPGEAILIVDTEAPPEPDKRGPYVPQPFSARELLELELPEVKWAAARGISIVNDGGILRFRGTGAPKSDSTAAKQAAPHLYQN